MLDAIRAGKARLLIWTIFGLIIVSFAFWGIENYVRQIGSNSYLAKVGGYRIGQEEFNTAYRNHMDQMRRMFGGNIDTAMLDNAEQRKGVLDQLINRHVLREAGASSGLTVTDRQLRDAIARMEVFYEDGKFSQQRYLQLLKAQGYTPASFEASMREDLLLQKMQDSISSTSFAPKFQVDQLLRANLQQREVSVAKVASAQFLNEAKVDDAAVKAYYDGHQDEFRVPEQVKLEYVMLSAEKFVPDMQASQEEIQKHYDDQAKQGKLGQPEERQASHILFQVKADATAEQKQAARAKAEAVVKEAQAKPGEFADLAKKHSEDAGSAQQGGDLGFTQREGWVKPFADAAFGMQVNEIRGPVESEFGYHIIKLVAIKPATTKSLAEISPQIANEIKREKANVEFSKVAEAFGNMVYEQSDSLKPAAEAYKLTVQQSDYLSRTGGSNPLLSNPKLMEAVFSDEAYKNKRNTQAVEVSPGVLVSARVIDSKPASMRKFDEVKAGILERLKQQQAAELAKKKGEASLADLKAGKEVAGLSWSKAQLASRENPAELAGPIYGAVFKADAQKLPAYVGSPSPEGFTLAKISKVVEVTGDDAKRKSVAERVGQSAAQEQMQAVVASLRSRASVKVTAGALERKAEAPPQ